MPPRFWIDSPLVLGPCLLEGSEAHHLSHVLRLDVGATVELFNGRGAAASATITQVAKRAVQLLVTEARTTPALRPRIQLAVAVPKGERFDWLVEKAVELGVAQLIPLLTARGTVDPRVTKLDRLRQVVIAACKQSRNDWAMEIAATIPWNEWLSSKGPTSTLLIADPRGGALSSATLAEPDDLFMAIGPEGGWTAEELTAGQQAGGWLMSLGPTILRIETAAIAATVLARAGCDRA